MHAALGNFLFPFQNLVPTHFYTQSVSFLGVAVLDFAFLQGEKLQNIRIFKVFSTQLGAQKRVQIRLEMKRFGYILIRNWF
jgi:hypothetical protein